MRGTLRTRFGALAVALLPLGLLPAACNIVTTADDIELVDDDGLGGAGEGGAGGGSVGSGASGGSSNSGGANTSSGPMSTSTSASTGGSQCAGGDPAQDAEEQAFLQILNNYRAQNNLAPLTECASLSRAAQGHSDNMRDTDFFDHVDPSGNEPVDRACDACYSLACPLMTAVGENIAAGNSGAQATFGQWQNSPGHNANMLSSSYSVIGIGRATGGGTYGTYWTTVFGGDSEPSCD